MKLLPERHRVESFTDSSPLLDEPAALRATAQKDGYLYLPRLIPTSLVAPVRALARSEFAHHGWIEPDNANPPFMTAVPDARLESRGWDDPRWVEFQCRFSSHPDFLAAARCDEIISVLEAIMAEPPWLAEVNFCWLKLPGSPEHTTLPHQDQWYVPHCERMWTAWIPLVDTPFEVGPLGVIAGSHLRGQWHHHDAFSGISVPDDVEWRSSEVQPGDVVFFGAFTVHCAWSNVSETCARVSADVRYEPKSVGYRSELRSTGSSTDE
jgi:ectoine hydroxylase-related dioxygenase (phytanoyl-CoA dioxygenase family)